jgi:rare lipoprotein A
MRRSGTWPGGWLLAAGISCWLAGCATPGQPPAPRPGGMSAEGGAPAQPLRPGTDGPPVGPLPDLSALANAEPRVEPIRSGGPNKPYEVLGQGYVPLVDDQPLVERGLASWYGRKFHGRRTASGETYNMLAMTAAHKTMPIPSYARVRNPANGREVIVRVNDRGPFSANRVIDLSYAAAVKLGVDGGVAAVEVERITHDEIRAGLPRPEVDLLGQAASIATAEPAWPRAVSGAAAAELPAVALAAAPSAAVPAVSKPAAEPAKGRPGVSVAQAEPRRVVTPPASSRAPVLAVAPAPQVAASASVSLATVSASPAGPAADPAPVVAAARATPGAQLPGTAPERGRAFTPAASGFWLQLGAFARGDGAYTFQQRVAQELNWLSPLLTVFAEGSLHRLQAGPYASRDQAKEVAERVRSSLQLVPVVVERR